ncbi:MAG: beta-lactamase family protein [Planctomycetes bacterium]|nr:beta-lactamase family protein [Planctomycetota bacterium]
MVASLEIPAALKATLLAALLAAPGTPAGDELPARVGALAEATLKSGPVAGLAIGLVRGEETLFAGGFGFADLEQRTPVTPHTFFRLASVTKQFTAAALLQLVEDGTLSLDEPITKQLPKFVAPGGTVTIRQLLNHTSGIAIYTANPAFDEWARHPRTPADVVAFIDGKPADFAPGSGFDYNNSAYFLAGELAARAAGKSYEALIEERLFGPLGMERSGYADDVRLIEQRAQGYAVEGGQFVNDLAMDMAIPGGAGALGSTLHDLLLWAKALPRLDVVGDESFAAMTAPTAVDGGFTVDYGLGLMLGTRDGQAWFGHGGNIHGFNCWIEWLPDAELAVVVLANTEGNHARELAPRLLRLLLPEPAAGAASSGAGSSGAAASAAPTESAAVAGPPSESLDALVGRYRAGERELTVARDGARLTVRARLDAQPGTPPALPLRFVGARDGRFDFAFEVDSTQHLVFEPAAVPSRATLTGRLLVRRFERK